MLFLSQVGADLKTSLPKMEKGEKQLLPRVASGAWGHKGVEFSFPCMHRCSGTQALDESPWASKKAVAHFRSRFHRASLAGHRVTNQGQPLS